MSVYESMTPAERSLRARTASYTSWANTPASQRSARARSGVEGLLRKFENEIDPDGILPPDERRQRAEAARRAHMSSIARKSVKSRRKPGQKSK